MERTFLHLVNKGRYTFFFQIVSILRENIINANGLLQLIQGKRDTILFKEHILSFHFLNE